MKKKTKWIVLLLLIICIGSYFFVPAVKNSIDIAMKALLEADPQDLIGYIRSYGKYAAVISFMLMILQSIISPIPAFFITLSNAVIFGWVKGAVLSWSSAMAGAALCFYIARILGRDVVEKITSKTALKNIDDFFQKYDKYVILVARLLPFISFDLVSYAAGLTSMKFIPFFIATGIGQLPATIVYSYVGGTLSGGPKALMSGLLILFSLSIIIYIAKNVYNEKQKKSN